MAQDDRSRNGGVMSPPPLETSRFFRAPPAHVFEAWSSAEHMRRWFSPEHLTVSHAVVDFRPGGAWEITMRAPDGQEFRSVGRYLEIAPPERLVFTLRVVDESGRTSFEALTTVTFAHVLGGTRMYVHQAYELLDPSAIGAVEGASEGWRTTLDKLETELHRPKTPAPVRTVVHDSFSLERVYQASPARVFQALTDPVAKARWFGGGEGHEVIERVMDVRPGGRERVRGRWATGAISAFDAVYFDVVQDRRLVYAYEMHMDETKISVSLATMEIEPCDAGARLKVTEQGAFLDGYDDAGSREHGTGFLLDRIGASL
jgi:uncharacterized protein YndB with AHSA1/START domain